MGLESLAELVDAIPTDGWNDGRCENYVHSFLFGSYRCEGVATALVAYACVHEHCPRPCPSCERCVAAQTDALL